MFDYIKNLFSKHKQEQSLVAILDDSRALFSYGGQNIYMSDFVNNCIDKIATEIGKLSVISVVEGSESVKRQNDEISRLFRYKPNPLQTTKDFLACCEWLRRKDCNCFIYPEYEWEKASDGSYFKYYTAFWPLNPEQIEFGVDDSNNIWEVKFYWRYGGYDIVPYRDLVHLRWRRGKNTIIGGGSDNGMPDTRELSQSISALSNILETVPKSLEATLKINGIYHAKTVVDKDRLEKIRTDFENHIASSKMGIVATDLPGEFTPVAMTPTHIDDTVMQFLKNIIRERYGISEAMLSGDYTAEQHGAFYQSCIEDFQTEFEQAMSSCLFTQREQDVGHRIKTYYSKTAFMTNQQKIELATLGTNAGLFTVNQILEMFGYEPQPDGDRKLQSLNYVSTDIADQYQLKLNDEQKGTQNE